MKKFLCAVLAVVIAVAGGAVFTACKKDEITSVSLEFSKQGEEVNFSQESTGDKSIQYGLTAQYGFELKEEDFTLKCAINNGESVTVKKQTEEKAGYTLDGMPSASVPQTGSYTLAFRYEGWTAEVKVNIEKKKLVLPSLPDGNEVEYDGGNYTARIVYDKTAISMLDTSERKLPKEDYYNVEFEIKDKDNYCWEDGQLGSEKFTYRFAINKKRLAVDREKYLKYPDNDGRFTAGSEGGAPTMSCNLADCPKTLEELLQLLTVDRSVISEFADLVELKLIKDNLNGSFEEVKEINASCCLALVVKDETCYWVGTTTQTTQFMSWLNVLTIIVT